MPHTTPIVFVVDDDPSVRKALELLIESAGWQPDLRVSTRIPGPSRALAPSCLVLDVGLPDLNGLDVQKQIAAERIDMPIIFITGYGNVPTTVQAMKAGALDFLTKPFDDAVLLSAIRDALERSVAALVQAAETRVLRDAYASLTRREREIMSSSYQAC